MKRGCLHTRIILKFSRSIFTWQIFVLFFLWCEACPLNVNYNMYTFLLWSSYHSSLNSLQSFYSVDKYLINVSVGFPRCCQCTCVHVYSKVFTLTLNVNVHLIIYQITCTTTWVVKKTSIILLSLFVKLRLYRKIIICFL